MTETEKELKNRVCEVLASAMTEEDMRKWEVEATFAGDGETAAAATRALAGSVVDRLLLAELELDRRAADDTVVVSRSRGGRFGEWTVFESASGRLWVPGSEAQSQIQQASHPRRVAFQLFVAWPERGHWVAP